MIEIDGAAGEGGGQILRTALALSMCTGRATTIRRIRAGRPKPGLRRQHLACVNAAVEISGATVRGAELGSQTLVFEPGPVRPGAYRFHVDTAGSCALVLQTVLPPLMTASAQSRVLLGGGTHNPMAPPFHFIERSFAPLVRRLGVGLELTLRRLGFYPAGGGAIHAVITPPVGTLMPFDLVERGSLREAYAECLAPGLPAQVAQRELEAVGQAMGWAPPQLRTLAVREDEGPGNALMATLVYEHVTEVITAFGEKGLSSEQVAAALVREVRAIEGEATWLAGAPSGELAGALGPYLTDQWLLPLSLALVAARKSVLFTCTELTEHARTNADVIQSFLPIEFLAHQAYEGMWCVNMTALN